MVERREGASAVVVAASTLKMTAPPALGTLLQIMFLPRTGLNRDWVPHCQSPIGYYRMKGRLLSAAIPSLTTIEVPPTTSMRLVSGLFHTARTIGIGSYFRYLWPSGRLLIAGNMARYSSQIGLGEIHFGSSLTAAQITLVRIGLASGVEYIINGPIALPYTAGAAKINPACEICSHHTCTLHPTLLGMLVGRLSLVVLLKQAQEKRPPVPVPLGRLGPAPGGIPRFLLKGTQVGVQFSIADRTKYWLPMRFRDDWPVANAFCSGVIARSMVEVATVPLRNLGNFRNIGYSTGESMLKVLCFPLLSSGINVLAKGLSFGTVLGLKASIDAIVNAR